MRRSIQQRLTRRARAFTAVAVLIAMTGSGCSRESGPDRKPSTPRTPSSSPAEQVTDSWESAFSSEQLDAYRQASARWDTYRRTIQPYNASGKANPAAKRVYQEFVIPWQVYFQRLASNASAGVKIARQARVLTSKATRIVLDDTGSSVTIEECLDGSDIGATQDGAPVANAFDLPQLSTVVMAEVNGRWMVSDIPVTTEDRPCDAQE
jgi:hypothetical protein